LFVDKLPSALLRRKAVIKETSNVSVAFRKLI